MVMHHEEKLRNNPEYKAAYDALEQEFAIADALVRARNEAGITQKDVAGRRGFSPPAVARMETGKMFPSRPLPVMPVR